MTTPNRSKLKILLENLKPGTAILASWLKSKGISGDLQKHYIKSGWLETIDRGVFKKPGDTVDYIGAVYALQNQTDIAVHIGSLTSLSLMGYSHYARFFEGYIFVFTPSATKLPKWFLKFNWGSKIYHKQSDLFKTSIGVKEQKINNIPILCSEPERAILECLYLSPKMIDLMECYQVLEGLVNLKPSLLLKLLKECNSIKVKRLFLYMAEKINHQWMHFLQLDGIELGNGNRLISEGGTYISKYQITIPKELADL